jgi:hypothetical protein
MVLIMCVQIFAQKVVEVSNSRDFLKAIKPGANIHLKKGEYNLSKSAGISSAYVKWEEVYDGMQLKIVNVAGLIITADENVTLLAEPRYAWVILFENCSDISLAGITAGHTVSGYCSGGVLGFSNCSGISINDCDLFGSGTEGLRLERVSRFGMHNTVIRECTYNIMTILESSEINFKNCRFTRSGAFDLFNISQSSALVFEYCIISRNPIEAGAEYLFFLGEGCRNIELKFCDISENKIPAFSNKTEQIEIIECDFSGNGFTPPASVILYPK